MDRDELLRRIAAGRTDDVIRLLERDDWREALAAGPVDALQWCVHYGDVTALRAVLAKGGTLAALDLDVELGNAAFHGHWRMCDFLLARGADARFAQADTGETALHGALAKAGRPHYLPVLRALLDHGADPNAVTRPGVVTEAFMRDVRTVGETPLHRAAAYGDAAMIRLLLERGARKDVRDAHGDSPLTWASRHLRPGAILGLLAYGPHHVAAGHVETITSDHGAGWGYGMERALLGEYLPEPREL